ncbi:MAG TPA: MBL fold metallo-hydrolase [Planctomycetota bacterium]|nr:MBL fold metallo-hydrolase [Planctomycetota bacterium]
MAIVHQVIPVGVFQANCNILADETSKTAVVIDPGDEPRRILEVVRDLGVRVTHLLHTHCHLDHITGTREVREETGASILIHSKDRFLYEGLKAQYASAARLFGIDLGEGEETLPNDGTLKEGGTIPLGQSTIKVIHTPGHTPGSCSFLLDAPDGPRLFTGDTLFAGSIGRTDLEGGDLELELESIQQRLMTLDPETPVFPGHGPATRIGIERLQNPMLL